MKRTTIKLSDEMDARLRHAAASQGRTISELTREAVEEYLMGSTKRRTFHAAKAGASGHTDTARRVEEILRQEALRSR